MRPCRSWRRTGTRTPGCGSGRRGRRPGRCSGGRMPGEKVGHDRGAAEVHLGRLPEELVLAGAGEAGRAEGAVHPVPGRGAGDRSDAAARLGRVGSRAAVAGAVADHRGAGAGRLGRRAAGPAGGGAGGAAAVGGAVARRGRSGLRGEPGRVLPGAARPRGPPRSARRWRNWPPGGPPRPARRPQRARECDSERAAARRPRHPRAGGRRGLRAAADRQHRAGARSPARSTSTW